MGSWYEWKKIIKDYMNAIIHCKIQIKNMYGNKKFCNDYSWSVPRKVYALHQSRTSISAAIKVVYWLS